MPPTRHHPLVLRRIVGALALLTLPLGARAEDVPRLPAVATGWSIRLLAEAPRVQYPTAAVVAPDGSIFVGQDPRDMIGPVNAPIDSVLLIRPDGSTHVFADQLQSVMGLEWIDGTLIVVHAPFLSSFRDEDGDGRAETRVDLITGLGPVDPARSGLNDHIASGVRLGIDGFLYIAVGDKGIPLATGRDGRQITLPGGGVIRVRPDGSDLEVVSTGERNPLSVVLNPHDEIFTFGNDDDSHLWPNSLTHHIVGGHYGYPFDFRHAPHRALPIVAGQVGGAGAQGMFWADDALPDRYQGNLVFCDWGAQTVARYEVEPTGATFRLVRREAIVTAGDLSDFRPFAVAPMAEPGALLVVDWAFNGWLGDGPPTGRLLRLDYTGPDRREPRPRSLGMTIPQQVRGLGHPSRDVRLAQQRRLVGQGAAAVPSLVIALNTGANPIACVGALWALDAIGTPDARAAIRAHLTDRDDAIRAQACRAVGIRRDPLAESALVASLRDPQIGAVVRREAAIALGRLGALAPTTRAALFETLGDSDPTVVWSIRRALRTAPPDPADADLLTLALRDPARRESAITLVDGWYRADLIPQLPEVADQLGDTKATARLIAALGGLSARVPEWSGAWWGSNPAAGPPPRATEIWDEPSRAAIRQALCGWIASPAPEIRRQALIAAIGLGGDGVQLVRTLIRQRLEDDPEALAAAVRFLGDQRDERSTRDLGAILADPACSLSVREAALDALSQIGGRAALNARLAVVYDANSPDALIARALPPLGQGRLLPGNDLIGFLDHTSPAVRAAALGAFPTTGRPLNRGAVEALLLRRDDPSHEVRRALAEAAARHGLRDAIPWLAEQARSDDPTLRSAATRALTRLPDPAGIPSLVTALGDRDPELRRAAVGALTPMQGEATPEVARRAALGEFQGAGALAAARLLARFEPIRAWRVIGPLPAATGPIFADARAIDFARPIARADGSPATWTEVVSGDAQGTLNLDEKWEAEGELVPEGATAFAVVEIVSERPRTALLSIEASGPMVVARDDLGLARFGAAVAGETVAVPLHEGTNRLLLRLRRGPGPWWVRVALSVPEAQNPGAVVDSALATPVRAGLRAVALRSAGDPRRGEALFREAGGVGCARCHAAGGVPAGVPGLAPSLDGLASKYDRVEIIRSILEPSSRIAVGYAPVTLELRDGTTQAGLLRGERPDGSVELIDASGAVRTVAAGSIERRGVGTVSTMPEGLVDNLKPIEFTDLVVYLLSLRAGPPEQAGVCRPGE